MAYQLVLPDLKIINLQFFVTVYNDVSMTLGDFQKRPRSKNVLDLSLVDIRWENKGYSIYQIVQNNDLPITENLQMYSHMKLKSIACFNLCQKTKKS